MSAICPGCGAAIEMDVDGGAWCDLCEVYYDETDLEGEDYDDYEDEEENS